MSLDNPIQLDDRTGSGDLYPVLRSLHVPVELTRMNYGDASFFGNGPDGCPIPVGIEIKQLSDVLKCITDGRFAGHQLPGLVQTYSYVWLVVEGVFRTDRASGLLQIYGRGNWRPASIGSRRFTGRELDAWLFTISVKGGVRIARTGGRTETAEFLAGLYHWWTDKQWEEHRSHLAADNSHQPDRALLCRPTLCRLVAKELPGIGWEKADAVAKKFGSTINMAVADVEDWVEIPGIGKKTAEKVVSAIRSTK